jgi:alpha-1,2-mannosyltransferase
MRGHAAEAPSPHPDGQIQPVDRDLTVRWWVLLGLLVWAALSVVLLLTTVPPRMPNVGLFRGGDDLAVYRDAGRHVVAHIPLYTDRLFHDHLYTYTPFSALTFVPFGVLPGDGLDTYIWMAANVVVLVGIIAQCWRMLGYRITPNLVGVSTLLALVCTFLEPVRTTLYFGQINLVLMLLVLWDTARGEHSRLKGVGVGIAAGIKLTPAYFILYFAATRQWRAAATALATMAATVGIGWIVLAGDSRQYWTETFFIAERVGAEIRHPGNQSLRAAIGRVIGDNPMTAIEPLGGETTPLWLWLLADVCVVIIGLLIAVRLHRGGERLLAVAVTGLSAAAVSPFAWSHHWVWFLPVLIYVVHRALTASWWWFVAAGLFSILGAWPYQYPIDPVPRVGLYMFPPTWVHWHIVVNLYAILYAVVILGAAVIAFRRPSLVSAQKSCRTTILRTGDF